MGYRNMIFDVMVMNMEKQLEELSIAILKIEAE